MIMFTESDKEKAISLHREEWGLLADNPALSKAEALEMMGYRPMKILNSCFLCQYSHDVAEQKGTMCGMAPSMLGMCKFCPLEWPGGACVRWSGSYTPELHLFTTWFSSDSVRQRVILARQISELPEKAILEPGAIFDGLGVMENLDKFIIYATKDGNMIPSGCICSIYKDGRGMELVGFINKFFRTDRPRGPIKIVP